MTRPAAVSWHRRLQTHVALGVILLVALSLGAVLMTTTRVITRRSMVLASDELDAARSACEHLADSRARFAAAQTRLITTLPVFRAHMADPRLVADTATLEAMADDYRVMLEAQFVVVTGHSGVWTAQPGWPTGQSPPPPMRANWITSWCSSTG